MSDARVRWLELTVALEDAEVVADELFGAGAVAVEELGGVGAVVLVTSFEATTANARANGVAVAVGEWGLDDVPGHFDLVLANVLAPVLVELAPRLVAALAPSGALVVSGLLAGRTAHVVDALAPLVVVGEDALDGWVAVTLRLP